MSKFNKLLIKKNLQLLAIVFAGGFFYSVPSDDAEEYTVKSVLSLNFARYTDWPQEIINENPSSINLCVMGDNLIQQTFALLDKKKVGERTLAIINLTRSKDLQQCQLLYISGQDPNITKRLVFDSIGKHILTIGDDDSFIKNGGMVYLQMQEGKINLHINLNLVKQAGLTISSRVLKLATIINP